MVRGTSGGPFIRKDMEDLNAADSYVSVQILISPASLLKLLDIEILYFVNFLNIILKWKVTKQ